VVDVTPLYETRVVALPSGNDDVPYSARCSLYDFDPKGSLVFDPKGSLLNATHWDITGLALDANANTWEEDAQDWNAFLLTEDNENDFGNADLFWLECGEATEMQHLLPLAMTGGQVFRAIDKAGLADFWFREPGRERLFIVQCKLADIPSRQGMREARHVALPVTEGRTSVQPSTDARDLVSWIEERLPDRSIEDLARLVSVSRATWSGWRRGDQLIRSGSRRRLIRLKRLLELRLAIAPEASVNLWLDTPVSSDLDVTPASLLAEGRDATVAMLAVQPSGVPEDGLVLTMPMDLGGLADDAATADKLERRALVGGSEEPE
jgi:hypothetical protein